MNKSTLIITLTAFAQKYIDFFEREIDTSPEAYYRFFDTETFPNECRCLGFEMDGGHRFIEAYGIEAWNSTQTLAAIIDRIDDVKAIGNALFSQWRYFNHWSYEHATKENQEWFLMLFHRLRDSDVFSRAGKED